jgi:hypothetical protein
MYWNPVVPRSVAARLMLSIFANFEVKHFLLIRYGYSRRNIPMGKHFGLFGSTAVTCMGRAFCGVILGLIVCTQDVAAMTYYISPTGDNIDAGTINTPWKTFDYAMSRTFCGDTLIVMDGTYTTATHGSLNITRVCTVGTPFLVQAQNERAALLQGDGSNTAAYTLHIIGSAYVTIDGLRVKSVDNSCCTGNNFSNIALDDSNHITLRNLLVTHNNRYQNAGLIRVHNTTSSLVEDSEFYSFHRYAISIGLHSSNNVVRRVYCHSRSYADIPGGYVSGDTTRGDGCVINYPTGATTNSVNNIIENSISEGQLVGFWVEAIRTVVGDQFLGDISLNDRIGFLTKARGSSSTQQPVNTVFTNVVAITSSSAGIEFRGSQNTQLTNATVYDSAGPGILADIEGTNNGGGTVSTFGTNSLSTLNTSGFTITEQTSWSFNEVNAFNNTTKYIPSLPANFTNATTTDPVLGTCRVYIPDASPMKGAGVGGADIGAKILYRYQNGVLTNIPLWSPTTGEFPHGAIVAGLNDVAGQSAFDVHKRLNVNTNGCAFPASFAQDSNSTPPTPPANLQVN